ncbi:MAG: N-6 DNA methylase [Planctomycetaceae bacterium]|jgi:type I restriction enzyme M protein|nr:N-6 DNA methylase [Planctomycetaceae bacterium]
MLLSEIIRDSNYSLALFDDKEVKQFEKKIETVNKNGKDSYIVECIVRKKNIQLKPEEIVRQLYATKLINEYHYPPDRLRFEYSIHFGREVKKADIVILDKDNPNTAYIIVEIKKPLAKDGRDQLKSYTNATGAPMAVWTNGEKISWYHRKNPNFFEDIPNIPKEEQTLADVLQRPFTMEHLLREDKLVKTGKSLKQLIEEMEDEVLANAGVDVFEEVFKLVFAKLYDEQLGATDKKRDLEFRNPGLSDTQLKERIQTLFAKACRKWEGVFAEQAKINLTPSHLAVCIASLQEVKLFNSDLDIVDEAFEYLINKSSKGEKGQYFTPRYVIDMCVKMLNPKDHETMIDPAAGSSGFPVHTIFHVWRKLIRKHKEPIGHLFTADPKPYYCIDYVNEKVFAIDFDERAVRVARTLNLIAGDGQTNVLHLNTLDYKRWENVTDDDTWNETYINGFKKLKRIQEGKDFGHFNFDIVMANPPFAGDIKESQILANYKLAEKDGKASAKVGRDILFIERNLNFLKPGGRMAIVLPQGRFNNSSDKYIRDLIAERCRILAVIGLHGNTFKPHTGTKTSVLFVQKWDEKLCPKKDDYNIFFATQQLAGKDNSGEKLYWKTDQSGSTANIKEALRDEHGHPIVWHDLFGINNKTPPGIAEAFMEFAKKEGLSFF